MGMNTAAVCCFTLLCTMVGNLDAKKSYRGYKLVSIVPSNRIQLNVLKMLNSGTEGSEINQLDFWTPPTEVGEAVDVIVPPDLWPTVKKFLKKHKIAFEVKVDDIQREIDKEAKESVATVQSESGFKSARTLQNSSQLFSFDKYHRFDTMVRHLEYLQARYPGLIRLKEIGKTFEHRSLLMAEIGTQKGVGEKPGFWIDGGIHAREWISPATVMFFIDKLVTEYSTDAKIKNLVDSINWYIVPVLNPDGYEYSHTNDRYWRNNRGPTMNESCFGIDLNRNFDFEFGCGHASFERVPCGSYIGPKAFSELESAAVRDFIMPRKHKIKGFITVHSASQFWLYPYSNKKKTYPWNVLNLERVAKKAIKALKSVNGTVYIVGSSDISYEAAGTSMDWAKAKANIEYTYTLELPPCNPRNFKDIFSPEYIKRECWVRWLLPATKILTVGRETWEGVAVVAEEIIKSYGRK